MNSGKGVCFGILMSRAVGDGEVESGEEQSPSGLSGV